MGKDCRVRPLLTLVFPVSVSYNHHHHGPALVVLLISVTVGQLLALDTLIAVVQYEPQKPYMGKTKRQELPCCNSLVKERHRRDMLSMPAPGGSSYGKE